MADSKRFVSLGNSQEEDVVEVRGGGTVTGRSGSSLRNNKERKRSSGWSDTDASPPRKSLRFESENDTKICDAAVEEVEGDEEIITGSYAHVRHNLEQIHSPASASKSLRAANANANGTANTKATTCIEKTKSPPYKLHWLSNKYVDQRRTNDEIHSSIRLSPILTAILDTPPMQRLRGLKQLGAAEYVYVNVNHNRFEHSLGVSYLAEKLCRRIRRNQPSLQCTEKDVLCVQLAGLMHDLGHGPFSHCYEHWICSDYPNHILAHPDQALKISNDDKDNGDSGDPGSSSKDWKHESATIMMIDAVLEHLGLAMDEENLDSPLKQIGDGVNAMSMRVGREPSSSEDDCIDATENCPQEDEYTKRSTVPTHDNGDNQKKINDLAGILTSRDILFVKECIWGTPIPLYVTKFGPGFHGRPHQRQDWLYDIVANRHSGLDVDKIDYYARDQRRALGESGEIDKVMMESAVVAWAPCTDPTNCHRCRQGEGKDSTIFRAANNSLNTSAKAHLCSPEGSGNNQLRYNDLYSSPPDFLTENKKKSASTAQTPDAKLHLMICYPTKLIKPSMEFFKTRFNLHSKIYRHKTIDGVECMVSDILSLAVSKSFVCVPLTHKVLYLNLTRKRCSRCLCYFTAICRIPTFSFQLQR